MASKRRERRITENRASPRPGCHFMDLRRLQNDDGAIAPAQTRTVVISNDVPLASSRAKQANEELMVYVNVLGRK